MIKTKTKTKIRKDYICLSCEKTFYKYVNYLSAPVTKCRYCENDHIIEKGDFYNPQHKNFKGGE